MSAAGRGDGLSEGIWVLKHRERSGWGALQTREQLCPGQQWCWGLFKGLRNIFHL